ERELVNAIAAERGVRVTVDKTRHGAPTASVDLEDVAVEHRQVAHPPDRLDRLAVAEHERVVEHLNLAGSRATQRSASTGRRRKLREIPKEELHEGMWRPPAAAASIASG